MYLTPFIFGALSASFALLIELVVLNLDHLQEFSSPTFDASSLLLLVAVALIEELGKYLFLRQYLLRYFKATSISLKTALYLGFFFGSGFSSLEVAFASADQTIPLAFFPLLGIVLIHILTSLILVSFLRFQNKQFSSFILPLILATLVHFFYNSFLLFVI